MYFLLALGLTILSFILFIIFRNKKRWHLEILTIIYGAATLMWLIDCFASLIKKEGFLSFEMPIDLYISLWTLVGGLLLWGIIILVINKKDKTNHR